MPRDPDRPTRVVRYFDFEGMKGDSLDLPIEWYRAQSLEGVRDRPGFPIFNRAALDYAVSASGEGSLRLPTAGGSTSVRLAVGVVPVFPGADYEVTAQVRTTPLQHARARLIAQLLDESGQPTDPPAASPTVQSPDAWTPLRVHLRRDAPGAAYLQIELQLLQPEQLGLTRPGQPAPQDFEGAVWFDNIVVSLLPRLSLRSDAPGNVTIGSQPPSIRADVRDLVPDELDGSLTVYDAHDRLADSLSFRISKGLHHQEWTPALTRFGWYRAVMTVRSGDALIASEHIDFAWLPPTAHSMRTTLRSSPDDARFQVRLPAFRAVLDPHTATLIERSGAGAVAIPVWDAAFAPGDAELEIGALEELVSALHSRWIQPTFILGEVPREVARQAGVERDNVLGALAASENAWGAQLIPILDRFGQRVSRWRIGQPSDNPPEPGALDLYPQAVAAISRLVPGPALIIPRTCEFPISNADARSVSAFEILVPSSFPPSAIPLIAEDLPDTDVTLAFDLLDTDAFARTDAADDLARRVVMAWETLSRSGQTPARAIAIPAPWTLSTESHPAMPSPLFPAWRTLVDQLADRRAVGRLDVGPDATCIILAPAPGSPASRTGCLILWREHTTVENPILEAYLGPGTIEIVDLDGNRTPVHADPMHTVPITIRPTFVEGADADLLLFLASLSLEPDFLPAQKTDHSCAITLHNPWDVPLTGSITIVSPGGFRPDGTRDRNWRITAPTFAFIVPPGQTHLLPIDISFSAFEEAGPKHLEFDLNISTAVSYPTTRVSLPFEVGISYLAVDLVARASDDAVVIEAIVANHGQDALTLDVALAAVGLPRKSARITQLQPGKQVRRSFVYNSIPDPQPVLHVSVIDAATGARVNKSVDLAQLPR